MATNTLEPSMGIQAASSERRWIARGLSRCSMAMFSAWLAPWLIMLGVGVYATYLCLSQGLGVTNLDNRFGFGLWIFLDLAVIALGAGAFFSGFLLYIMKWKEIKAVISSAVVLGFLCYSGAMAVLAVDVGQPLRAWFTFWHPNVHSMLTEVTFCITCYLIVLSIEYLPIILKNRRLKQVPSFLVFEWELHKLIPVLAGIGCLLSFFHQGSLGGLFGVMRGRPFAFREGFAIWPSTFFLFVLSAAAVGPSFIILTTKLVEWITSKRLVKPGVYLTLAKTTGVLLTAYVALKSIDTLIWLNSTSVNAGFAPWEYYEWKPFGGWILFAEIVIFGMAPALMLLSKRLRTKPAILIAGAVLACTGVVLIRFVMTIQTLALPTLSFDQFLTYTPNWVEFAVFGMVIAYAVIVYSLSYRYLNLFPQEKEIAAEVLEVADVPVR